jgi:hypothetical protein
MKSAPKRKRTRNAQQSAHLATTQIPFSNAIALINTSANESTTTNRGLSYLGNIELSPTGTPYTTSQFVIDPSIMGGRIQVLAYAFQKYRFRRMRMVVATAATSVTGGVLTAGYCENPEQDFTSGTNVARQQVISLPGAVATQFYVFRELNARINDKNKWYNIDSNSAEKMSTQQGKFVLNYDAPVGLTAPLNIDLYLDYEVELKGAAIQDTINPPLVFQLPSLINHSTASTNQPAFWAVDQAQAFPSITYGKTYEVYPPAEISVEGELVLAQYVYVVGGVTGGTGLTVKWFATLSSVTDNLPYTVDGNSGESPTNTVTTAATWTELSN